MWTSLLHAGLAGSFMRFPHVPAHTEELRQGAAGAAIYGIPFDSTNISRTGSNYGPRGIRDVSVQFLTYNAMLDFDVADALSPVDCGDCDVIPGDPARTFERAQVDLEQILRAGALPVTLGESTLSRSRRSVLSERCMPIQDLCSSTRTLTRHRMSAASCSVTVARSREQSMPALIPPRSHWSGFSGG